MEKKQQEETVHDESVLNPERKNEMDLPWRERRLIEKEKIKGMGFGKKIEYIWMYYKMVFIGILCFILCIHLGINWYHNAQIKSVLSVSVVNSPSFEPEPIEEEIMEILGCAGDEFSKVEIFSNMNTDQTGEALDYYNQMSYIARLQAKEIDVIIFPESLYKAINVDEIFLDMKEVLDPETYEAFGEQVKGSYLALENTKLNEEMTIYYEPVCLAVPMNAQHIENAGKWIATLAE